MPSTHNSSYKRPSAFFSGHLETIYPALFRKVKNLSPATRERLSLRDEDFVDLDWRRQNNQRLVIIQHGLEGSSDRPYMLGMARHFYQNGYDTLAWNYRGCSGEANRKKRFYHSGATDDLHEVIENAEKNYQEIFLVGFSLGGNITLKYIGEATRSPKIKAAVAISTPLDLDAGASNLSTLRGKIYERRFLKSLKKKLREKDQRMPGTYDMKRLAEIKTIRQFDDAFTSQLHGFKNAKDYYQQCSSRNFLKTIQIPTLILNAVNDPFLTSESLDHALTQNLPWVHMETTTHGGHVGFISQGNEQSYWSEQRALTFCDEYAQ